MKILMIGNGFDLAHDLPTSYMEFLQFCHMAGEIKSSPWRSYFFTSYDFLESNLNDTLKGIIWAEYNKYRKAPDENLSDQQYDSICQNYKAESHAAFEQLCDLLKENVWYSYFSSQYRKNRLKGITWIDFEVEISRVIKDLNDKQFTYLDGDSNSPGAIMFFVLNNSENPNYCFDNKDILRLEADLYRLIRALEIYLSAFVEVYFDVRPLKQIQNIKADHLISFNYTDTFTRLYNPHMEKYLTCYIHGKCSQNGSIESNNMVIGIDEFLKDGRQDTDLTFVAFKKYYQRILKQTDVNYFDWIKEVSNPANHTIENNLYIFGHSLDKTDRDVIRKLISTPNMKTHIYYYRKTENDREDLAKKIQNLILIFGSDEVTRMSGEGIINFIPQEICKEGEESSYYGILYDHPKAVL